MSFVYSLRVAQYLTQFLTQGVGEVFHCPIPYPRRGRSFPLPNSLPKAWEEFSIAQFLTQGLGKFSIAQFLTQGVGGVFHCPVFRPAVLSLAPIQPRVINLWTVFCVLWFQIMGRFPPSFWQWF